jgi:hypothetical protein
VKEVAKLSTQCRRAHAGSQVSVSEPVFVRKKPEGGERQPRTKLSPSGWPASWPSYTLKGAVISLGNYAALRAFVAGFRAARGFGFGLSLDFVFI